MNQEDIIEMAQKAGWQDFRNHDSGMNLEVLLGIPANLERFAILVAAAEREKNASLVEQMGMEGYGTLAIAAAIRSNHEQR